MRDWIVAYATVTDTAVQEFDTRLEAWQFATEIVPNQYPTVYLRDRGNPYFEKIIIVEQTYDGQWHAMFRREPSGVRGCPLGRGDLSAEEAVNDLLTRTNWESKLNLRKDQFKIEYKED